MIFVVLPECFSVHFTDSFEVSRGFTMGGGEV
jgi:hypothetical protein